MPNKALFSRPRGIEDGRVDYMDLGDIWDSIGLNNKQIRNKQMSQGTLATLSRAVSEHFADDSTKPGVLFAYLPGENMYYCAVHRYFSSGGRSKQVIVSCKNVNPELAVDDVARQFLSQIGKVENAVDQLRRAVRH